MCGAASDVCYNHIHSVVFLKKLVEGKRKGIGRRLLHILSLLWVLRGKAPMICAYEALSLVPMLSALFGVRLQCVIGKQDNSN